MKIFSVFLLLFALSACLEMKQKEYHADFEKMETSLNTMQKIGETVDSSKAREVLIAHQDLIDSLKAKYTSDTISVTMAQHIENIKYTIYCLQHFFQNYAAFGDLNMKKTEVEKLKKMISNGDGNRENYDELMQKEKDSISNLKNNFEELLHYYTEGTRDFSASEQFLKSELNA